MFRCARVFAVVVAAGSLFGVGSAQAAARPVLAWSPTTSSQPPTYDFGAVAAVAGKTASQTFKLTNSGGTATSALTLALTGSSEFSKVADTCTGTSLGPKKSCSVTIKYAPTVGGEIDTATLTASSPSGRATAALLLEGNGATSVSCPGQRFVTPSAVTVPALTAGSPDCQVTFAGGEFFTAETSVAVPWATGSTAANGTFNQSGQLVRFADAAGGTTSFNPGAGGVLTATDPLGHSTSLSYDASGDLVTVGQTSLVYDSAGRVLSVTNGLGDKTAFTYDSSGDLITVTDSSGTTNFTYDSAGEVVSVTGASGTTTFTYNSAGELLSKTDASGTTSFTYDSAGEVVSVTGASGTTTFTYNSAGELLTKTDASGTTSFTYDSAAELVSATDPSGHASMFTY